MQHTMLECDCSGLKYTIEDHDITLKVPEGAVENNETILIEIDVSMYGCFVFPKEFQPISPIVWLCILEKDTKLRKPFQLILPHFLTGLSREKLCSHQIRFAKANHDKCIIKGGEMKYEFNSCDSKPLIASSGNKNFAVLESDHCCFYCLQANQTPELIRDASYCLTRIQRSSSLQRNEVYFLATYLLDTCIQVQPKGL